MSTDKFKTIRQRKQAKVQQKQKIEFYNLKEMEKTISYSKKTSISRILLQYESCSHDHCKQFLHYLKIFSNALTEKMLKEQFSHISNSNVLISKESIAICEKSNLQNVSQTIKEQIQTIKKNYLKIKNQLNSLEAENDQLFEENVQLQKKVQKLEQMLGGSSINKSTIDQSQSRNQQISAMYLRNSCFMVNNRNFEKLQKEYNSQTNRPTKPHTIDFNFNNIFEIHHAPTELRYSTDSSEIYARYEKLLKLYKNTEEDYISSEQKVKDLEQFIKKLQYENQQLKKIIKLRNQIQSSRNMAMKELKSVIDCFMQ